MSGTTAIEWTDATWNPVTGCTKVSPGCDHCYAERITERFHGPGSFERVILHPDRLDAPLHWRKPRMVFVNSMSDLFHSSVRYEYIREVFNVMRRCNGSIVAATGRRSPAHSFQVLTKRAERMERLARTRRLGYDPEWPPANVWLGVSVESPAYYARIRHLQRTPAAVRFLSLEPLLAPLPDLPLEGIHWVIVGGESGPGARPMHPLWVRDIRDQCVAAKVPFFFKQWGAFQPQGPHQVGSVPEDDAVGLLSAEGNWRGRAAGSLTNALGPWSSGVPDEVMRRVGKHAAGRMLDGVEWSQMPATVAR